MRRRIVHRLKTFRGFEKLFLLTCFLFMFIQYLSTKLILWERSPSSMLTRLYADMPMTIDLRSYSVCHPKNFSLENLTTYYHQYSKHQQTCFLIEHLDGGPWWSYVTHEFAEILTHLKDIGSRSNIVYRPFPQNIKFDYKTNLTEYFLNACHFDEDVYMKNKVPIVVLIWDVNRLVWYKMHDQWAYLFDKLQIRILTFIDDLHFVTKESFSSRQYLFQFIASEIFSTYPYIFHNYYYDISSSKLTWLPHAASTLSYRTINRSAEHVLFVSGAHLFEWYPCRSRGFLLCQIRKDLAACLKHPGYGETMKNDSSFFYGGKRYFEYMKQYVFGLGTCESVHYAIAKLFEIPANGLVLVTTNNLVPILERLQLYQNEHFLTVKCSSLKQLTKEMLRLQNISRETIDQIRIQSQNIVYERHLTQHRAELLHVRLLAHALMIMPSNDDQQRTQLERWGRNCN